MQREPGALKKQLRISFVGEAGIDAGGLSREFFFLLSHAMVRWARGSRADRAV